MRTRIVCKEGVLLKRVTPALAWIFYVLDGFVRNNNWLPVELVITSIEDGKHAPNSRHYRGEAIDIRSKNFLNRDLKRRFRSELESALNHHPLVTAKGVGDNFRVLLEVEGTPNEHFHVQVRKGQTFPGV